MINPEGIIVIFIEYFLVCIFGSYGYGGLELLWRGRTHWSMLMTGGICFLCIYLIANKTKLSHPRKCILCAASITTIEYLAGIFVNIKMGWEVWDYSSLPFHLNGQICLPYTAIWLLLSIPCLWLSGKFSKLFTDTNQSP